jgi:hypothetical protein
MRDADILGMAMGATRRCFRPIGDLARHQTIDVTWPIGFLPKNLVVGHTLPQLGAWRTPNVSVWFLTKYYACVFQPHLDLRNALELMISIYAPVICSELNISSPDCTLCDNDRR